MALAGKQVAERKLAHLRGRGLDQLFIAVAERRAPQPGHALDIGLAVAVIDEHALAALDDQRAGFAQRRKIGVGVGHGFDVADGEVAEWSHGFAFGWRRSYWRRTVLAVKSASTRSWRIAPATNGAGTAYDRSVFVVMVGGCRPGHWQRHRRHRLLAGLAHVPLAHAVAAGSLGEVHMHVVLVIAVGGRTKDRGEACAGALAQAETKILADLGIGQPHDDAVGKLYRPDVDGVGLAVFG